MRVFVLCLYVREAQRKATLCRVPSKDQTPGAQSYPPLLGLLYGWGRRLGLSIGELTTLPGSWASLFWERHFVENTTSQSLSDF